MKKELDVISPAKEATDVQNPADTKRTSYWVSTNGLLRKKNSAGVASNFIISGNGTLVPNPAGGQVTIADANVTANTLIMVSRKSDGPSAAPGFTSYTLNPGVGFTIISSSVNDDGDVTWKIMQY